LQTLLLLSAASCSFLRLRYKYSPQPPVIEHPEPVFIHLTRQVKLDTHTQQLMLYILMYFFEQQLSKQNTRILNRLAANITRIYAALDLFVKKNYRTH
jgi:hypothetical protein